MSKFLDKVIIKPANWINDRIISLDQFPQKIELTYKAQNNFKTTVGGWVSVVIIIFIILTTIQQYHRLTTGSNTIKTTIDSVHDFSDKNLKSINFERDNYVFGFGIEDIQLGPQNYSDYLNVSIYQNQGFYYNNSKTNIGIVPCSTITSIFSIYPSLLCPDTLNLNVAGYIYESEFSQILIEVKR